VSAPDQPEPAREAAPQARRLRDLLSGRNLTGRATLNAVAGGLDYGARIAVTFLLNPLLVAGLGTTGFGLWQVLRQLTAYAGPASGRPAQALKWTITSRSHRRCW
jgi:hypothetical protein